MSTQPQSQPQTARGPAGRFWRWKHAVIIAASVAAILLICCGILAWYANTAEFQNKVRRYVIAAAEQATGGRVELQGFHWRLLHLEVDIEGLTIHGLEAVNEVPYLHIDHLRARAKIIAFLSPKIGLNLLEVEHPVFHLIVYPDGTTNQPKPKQHRNGKPLKDTLFDLAVDRTSITNGLVLLNKRSIPFDLAGQDLEVLIAYKPGAGQTDRYIGNLAVSDLMTQRGNSVPVHSRIEMNIEAARNAVELKSFHLTSKGTSLVASGVLNDFNHPKWQFISSGNLDIRELEALTAVRGLESGLVELSLKGNGGAGGVWDIAGDVRAKATTYHTQDVNLQKVDARMKVDASQDELALSSIRADLPPTGHVDGYFRLIHWLNSNSEPENKAEKRFEKKLQQQAIIRATLNGVPLRTIMNAVAKPGYQDLGFDTLVSGPANVDWTGTSENLTVDGNLQFTPRSQTPIGEVPLSGVANAIYDNRTGTVQIRTVDLKTPASKITVTGGLGVYPISRSTQVSVNLTTSNLSELDKTLSMLGLNDGEKHGSQALPVHLQGEAEFHGEVSQSLRDPDVKGHVHATNFVTLMTIGSAAESGPAAPNTASSQPVISSPAATTRTLQWDSLDANAEYSSRALIVQQATVSRGKSVIHVSGQLTSHRVDAHTSSFDESSGVRADVQIQNASAEDLLSMAGRAFPVTGTVTLNTHVDGQLNRLLGGGHLSMQGGQIYGESYRSVASDIVFSGEEIGLSKLTILQDGGQIRGSGGYNFHSKDFHLQATGSGFELAHFEKLKNPRFPLTGQLDFQLQGQGTLQNPSLTAAGHLVNLTVGGEQMGSINLEAHTQQRKLIYHLTSTLKTARVEAHGQTELQGNYPTQANLNFSQFDIDSILKLAGVDSISGHSAIAGVMDISGPAKYPRQMNGEIKINELAMTLQGVSLKSDGAVHAALKDGVLHLDPLHITGDGTDIRADGNLGIVDRHDLNLRMRGSVNMRLAQVFNPDLTASGLVDFNLDAGGTTARPDLRGNVQFKNVAVAYGNFPNGLSQMNGNLQFNQDRLEVRTLTAMTGGGQISLKGYFTYQSGLYEDLTATGKNIRIRYPQGISSVVDTNLRLQGSRNNQILSGNVLITRFALNPNLDLAAFAGASNSVSPVPNPNAPENHVRLDIRISSAPALNFQNSFAKLAGDVDLRIRGTLATPSVLGRVTVTEGSAVFAGTQYQLQHGEIFFTNPVRIEPTIDLNAMARVEDYDITIGVHGTPNKLNVSYRSEPPLPQADVIALLALGRTQEEQRVYQQQQQAAGVNSTTDALLSGALNATVSNRVQKLFGVGSVKIDPTFVGSLGNSTARITVEQQVSKHVTLTYATNVNSTAQQLIQAEFDLTRTVSLLAVRDEAGVFSMVVRVHRRYR